MSGYVESHVSADVARAYERLAEQQQSIKSAATVILQKAHWSIARKLKHSLFPMRRLVAEQVRGIFSGENGRRTAVVLSFAPVTLLFGEVKNRRGITRYSLGPDGLLKVFFPKKGIFRKTPKPVVSQVSIEELCCSADPKEVYRALYKVLHLAAAEVLQRR